MSITTVKQLKTLIQEAVEDANSVNDNEYNFTIPPKEVVREILHFHIDYWIRIYYSTKKIWNDFVNSSDGMHIATPNRPTKACKDVIWKICIEFFRQQSDIVAEITQDLPYSQAKTVQLPFKKNSAEEYIYKLLFKELKQYAIDQNKFKTALMSCIAIRKNDLDTIDAQIKSKYPEIFSKLKQILILR